MLSYLGVCLSVAIGHAAGVGGAVADVAQSEDGARGEGQHLHLLRTLQEIYHLQHTSTTSFNPFLSARSLNYFKDFLT